MTAGPDAAAVTLREITIGEPGGFYRACGFVETGEEDRGEPLLLLALQDGAAVSPR